MACVVRGRNGDVIVTSDTTKDTALDKFKAGVIRGLKQYNAGQIKVFDDIDEALNYLHNAK